MNLFKLCTLCVVFFMALPALASESEQKWTPNTLVSGKYDSGGYGALMVKYRTVNGKESVWAGGRGGWIVNHNVVFGGGGYGLCNIPKVAELGTEDVRVAGGYGGLFFEYIFFPERAVHFSSGLMVGAGGFNFFTGNDDGWEDDWEDTEDYNSVQSGVAFVANPWVSMDINILPFMRFGIEADYMVYEGVNYGTITDRDMGGPSVGVTFKFGHF